MGGGGCRGGGPLLFSAGSSTDKAGHRSQGAGVGDTHRLLGAGVWGGHVEASPPAPLNSTQLRRMGPIQTRPLLRAGGAVGRSVQLGRGQGGYSWDRGCTVQPGAGVRTPAGLSPLPVPLCPIPVRGEVEKRGSLLVPPPTCALPSAEALPSPCPASHRARRAGSESSGVMSHAWPQHRGAEPGALAPPVFVFTAA